MRVTLLNEGMDAYKPAEYGRRIVVERKLNKGGGGGYTLLGVTGGMSALKNGKQSSESYTVTNKRSSSCIHPHLTPWWNFSTFISSWTFRFPHFKF